MDLDRGTDPQRAPPDEARRLARPDGATIAYRVRRPDTGAPAAPVLMLHGLASNLSRYDEFVEHTALVAQHVLLRVDLRGHGGSLTRRRIDSARWCDDLAALLQAERAGPAIVVGHSLGAQVALQLAQRHPRHVRALVLIDPVFRAALHGHWRWLARASPLIALAAAAARALAAIGLHRGALPPLDLRALDAMARRALASPQAEAEFVRRYSSTRADLRHVPTSVYLQDLVEMFRPAPLPRSLGVPVLALLSSGATFADAAAMRTLLAGPQVRLQDVECQHWPLTERPREVREAIERWVQALPDG
ncbi:MAG: alpha/beta hydrolase [Rhodoferax sp.]|jgi:pimeloyl-ACP methyl ester carboxylesterase|nr:alpha/beta hydrolase [Rhodoferax sp.]MCP5288519.1 alpha/beta hydrolase [Burkholderiaceae bacterium]HMQ72395.1 alpha/beta hydrolase [Rubrivivax sp.]